MKFIDELEDQIKEYLSGDYEIIDVNSIPSVEDVQFKKKVFRMNLCAYSIDIRKSSNLLVKHRKKTSGKIHKAFLTITSKISRYYEGEIRSFQGDSILVFWPANLKSQIMSAVRAAMEIKWLLSREFSNLFEKYSKLDYGIGIDWGEVYIIRAGISRNTNNNDLVFIGRCVNFAVAIANQAKSPSNIEISSSVYNNLEGDYKFATKNSNKVNMWKDGTVRWNGVDYKTKITNYSWSA